jgi:hypothetical protein
MCNLGTKEGVTDKEGRFAGVWPANRAFFEAVRSRAGLIAVAVDPLTSHECGNQRYLAIPWLDACLSARLATDGSVALRPLDVDSAWLSEPLGTKASASQAFTGDKLKASWHLDERMAKLWEQYVVDTQVSDPTAPPRVTSIEVVGKELRWNAEGDVESGIAAFEIYRDGGLIATLGNTKNPFGRGIYQGLQYSDTPQQPLVEMVFLDDKAEGEVRADRYKIIAINTVGLKSE